MSFYLFAGEIPAQKDIWIIGDAFVNDTYHTVKAINTAAQQEIKHISTVGANSM